MKKRILLFVLLTCIGVFGQKTVSKKVSELIDKNVTFKSYEVLTESTSISNTETKKAVEKATFAKINSQAVTQIVTNKENYIEIQIPYLGTTITTQLYKVDLFAEGFHVDSNTQRNIAYEQGVYYRGIIKGDLNSTVSFNFFKSELNGIISNHINNNLVVGKLDKQNNTTDYIIYSDRDLKVTNDFKCQVKNDFVTERQSNGNISSGLTAKCVTMYFEIDNDLYNENNSNTTTTTNWMTSVFNNVQTLYSNDGITIALKSIFIWITPDPYDGIGNSSSDYLYKFNEVRPVFDGDVGQLLGIDGGGLGGVAVGINGICTQDNFSYSDVNFSFATVPNFSWTIMVISHEFGHLLGSPHTHGCHWNGDFTAIDGCGQQAGYFEGDCPEGPIPDDGGTVMSYCHLAGTGINFGNGFGAQPATRILGKINAGSCLSSDCINTCINTVANIASSNATTTSALITWADLGGATTWEISVRPFSITTDTWVPVSTNSYSATNLTPNTFYIVRVRPNCDFGLIAPNEQSILLTSATYCSGVQITDTGGPTGDYTDSESYVRTIIPNLPDKKIALSFSSFDLELDYDYLYIYDGNSTSASDLSNGGFTGNEIIPGPFVSSATDGSLTLKFYSDGGVVAPGFVANIACQSSLGNAIFESNIDFTYTPNPTNGAVSITSRTAISEVLVYNLEGRLLYQNAINGLNTKVDLSSFAKGTYFFKLKFNDKEANFKILKM